MKLYGTRQEAEAAEHKEGFKLFRIWLGETERWAWDSLNTGNAVRTFARYVLGVRCHIADGQHRVSNSQVLLEENERLRAELKVLKNGQHS